MAVSDLEQRSGRVNRDEQRGAGNQGLVIEIAGVRPGRIAAHAAGLGRRGNAHAPEKRL